MTKTRGTTDKFKRRFIWIMNQMEKRSIELGGVTVDGDKFTIFTPEGQPVEGDAFDKWEAEQAES